MKRRVHMATLVTKREKQRTITTLLVCFVAISILNSSDFQGVSVEAAEIFDSEDFLYGMIYSCPAVSPSYIDYSSVPISNLGYLIEDFDSDTNDELLVAALNNDYSIRLDIYEQESSGYLLQDTYNVSFNGYDNQTGPLYLATCSGGVTDIYAYEHNGISIGIEESGYGIFATGVNHAFMELRYDGDSFSIENQFHYSGAVDEGLYASAEDYEELNKYGVTNIDYALFWECRTCLREHMNEVREVCRIVPELQENRDLLIRLLDRDELDLSDAVRNIEIGGVANNVSSATEAASSNLTLDDFLGEYVSVPNFDCGNPSVISIFIDDNTGRLAIESGLYYATEGSTGMAYYSRYEIHGRTINAEIETIGNPFYSMENGFGTDEISLKESGVIEIKLSDAWRNCIHEDFLTGTYYLEGVAKGSEEAGAAEQFTPSSSIEPYTGFDGTTITTSYMFEDSNTRRLSKNELINLSQFQLLVARNEIYARHGRMFNMEALVQYFSTRDWYHPTIPAEQFSDYDLSDIELENARLILEVEHEKGIYY